MTDDSAALQILDDYIRALRDLEAANKMQKAAQDAKDAALARLQTVSRARARSV